MFVKRCWIIILFILIDGCAAPRQWELPAKTQQVIIQGEKKGFSLKRYSTSSFVITTYQHLPTTTLENVHVYIEGDGHSWKSRYRLSNNPTPRQPLALQLAIQDPYYAVVYIARPCQYTPHQLDSRCAAKYWSSHRYAEEVITAINEVLDQLQAKSYTLVGFSGGASVAVLVASRRHDVIGLYTVAGDLDHELLNEYHNTTPLSGSLNPKNVIHLVKNIPQAHWCGSMDRIVPCWTVKEFVEAENNPACVEFHTLKGAEHHKGWVKAWAGLIEKKLQCDN